MILHADEFRPAMKPGRVQRLRKLPGIHGGRPNITDLAVLPDIVQGLQRLLDRRLRIPSVNLIEVDVIGPEPPQAVFDFTENCAARQASFWLSNCRMRRLCELASARTLGRDGEARNYDSCGARLRARPPLSKR